MYGAVYEHLSLQVVDFWVYVVIVKCGINMAAYFNMVQG